MRHISCILAPAALAVALAGCGDPYYPRSGYSQTSYSPSGYSYPSNYSSYPAGPSYYPTNYGPSGNYYGNYGQARSSPQVTFSFP